jgi:hypothetical protein
MEDVVLPALVSKEQDSDSTCRISTKKFVQLTGSMEPNITLKAGLVQYLCMYMYI